VLEVARALAEWRPDAALRYAGDPPRPIEMTEEALGAYLARVRGSRGEGRLEVFRLADATASPRLALFLKVEGTGAGRVETLWFSLPFDLSGPPFELGRLMRLIGTLCQESQAHHGAVEDWPLLALYRGRRAAERARSRMPPHLRQFALDPLPVEGVTVRPPSLLVPQEFDRRRVPDAVWWVNFMDHVQVQTVSRESVLGADWQSVVELGGGDLVLAATEEPTEVTNAAHMERLRRIVERLNLDGLQRQYQYEECANE